MPSARLSTGQVSVAANPTHASRGHHAYQNSPYVNCAFISGCLYRAGANSGAVTDGNSCINRSPNANPFAYTRTNANICANADLKTPAYGDTCANEYLDSNTHVNANPGANTHAHARTHIYAYSDTGTDSNTRA